MARTYCTSKMILLGPSDLLNGIQRPDFLHRDFFLLCTTRDECTKNVAEQTSVDRDIDIFLPDTAIDLIHVYQRASPTPRIRFYLYCSTDNLVNPHKRLIQLNICEQVFNVNQIEEKLYMAAQLHLIRCLHYLKKCADDRDDEAFDLLHPMSELVEQNTIWINGIIRRITGLPQQAEDFEQR